MRYCREKGTATVRSSRTAHPEHQFWWSACRLGLSYHTCVPSVVYCSNLTKLEYYLSFIDNVCFAKLDFTLQPLLVDFIFDMYNSTNGPFQQMPVAVVSPWSCYRIVGYWTEKGTVTFNSSRTATVRSSKTKILVKCLQVVASTWCTYIYIRMYSQLLRALRNLNVDPLSFIPP